MLRVIEKREVRRIGGKVDFPINVTIIATTNTNLEQALAARRFRTDLFFRLNTFPLHIPPLRERREDIPLLAAHFLAMFSQTYLKKIPLPD